MDQLSQNPRPARGVSQGYALCNATGQLLAHTFRQTAEEAIESAFPTACDSGREAWEERLQLGWSVEFVYARLFTPKFYVDVLPEERVAP